KGGVLGGSLIQGTLRVGDEVEILPGLGSKQHPERYKEPIRTRVTSIVSGGKSYEEVHAGGLLGVGTSLDPALTKSDNISGKIKTHDEKTL
ncbi:MAG: translation initiation factor IF-2 subunit gamma, partial [SAR324 cluster bacterium]